MKSKKSTKKSVKSEQPKAKKAAKPAPVKVPSLKKLLNSIVFGERPRGLKFTIKSGMITFNYGTKAQPVSNVENAESTLLQLLGALKVNGVHHVQE